MDVTCQDVIALLGDYLEATLGAADVARLEGHLDGCAECVAYLNTYRKTTALARAAGRVEIPGEMRRRLRDFLISRLPET